MFYYSLILVVFCSTSTVFGYPEHNETINKYFDYALKAVVNHKNLSINPLKVGEIVYTSKVMTIQLNNGLMYGLKQMRRLGDVEHECKNDDDNDNNIESQSSEQCTFKGQLIIDDLNSKFDGTLKTFIFTVHPLVKVDISKIVIDLEVSYNKNHTSGFNVELSKFEFDRYVTSEIEIQKLGPLGPILKYAVVRWIKDGIVKVINEPMKIALEKQMKNI